MALYDVFVDDEHESKSTYNISLLRFVWRALVLNLANSHQQAYHEFHFIRVKIASLLTQIYSLSDAIAAIWIAIKN